MRNYLSKISPVRALIALNCLLGVSYIALVAFSMSYAALEVEFAQSVKNDEASVATLDTSYLATLKQVTLSNYAAEGYVKPVAEIYVPGAPQTALNFR